MLFGLVLTIAFARQTSCVAEAAAVAAATARAQALDPAGALARVDTPAGRGCGQAEIARLYLSGLLAAREAYSRGGDPVSLRPVRDAIARLEVHARRPSPPAEIARLVLLAAASAAQSEREEMGVFLEHAIAIEALQLSAHESGAPVVTAHEIAGDLWLLVHQYERARTAYARAVAQVGSKPRLTVGLARVAVRLKDAAGACAEYGRLLAAWHWSVRGPAEAMEARAFLRKQQCRSSPAGRR
jgi:hypothetical protein